ncbi:hypothetical protein WH47_12606, partial [Habropoda laboriosa]
DNARVTYSRCNETYGDRARMESSPHLPHFPYVAPSDSHAFRSLQHSSRGMHFQNVVSIHK